MFVFLFASIFSILCAFLKANNKHKGLFMKFNRFGLLLLGVVGLTSCADKELPEPQVVQRVVWLEQNWNNDQRQWFHYVSQGTATFFIPYEWFIALEQPGLSLFGKPLIVEGDFLERLGFIAGSPSAYNKANLPVGLAVDYEATDLEGRPYRAIGLTCAACHTGQLNYKGTGVRYDGGPSMISANKLMGNIFNSMLETYASKRQFKRFAKRVLADQYSDEGLKELRKEYAKVFMFLIKQLFQSIAIQNQEIIKKDIEQGRDSKILLDIAKNVKANLAQTEGYGRTDALNRIGNQVFALDAERPENFVVPNAPVSFPFIWSSSWFAWVQYDGSIMQPMIRNAGEALGVGALLNLNKNKPNNFASSVHVMNLHAIETALAGDTAPFEYQQFSGLRSPQWPQDILGNIDQQKAASGEQLYKQYCQQCHLPPVSSPEFWNEQYWSIQNLNGARLLDLPIYSTELIGTDPNQARVLAERTVNTIDMGLATQIFAGEECGALTVTDDAKASYAFSLGAVVQETVNLWYSKNAIPNEQQQQMNGYLPNCLRATKGYKARPLNGIWATAPFLHNGSVPNLFALLSPVSERPQQFYVGNLEFDPALVGYETGKRNGLFLFDTSKDGNSNQGHEFNNTQDKGVIGPLLSVAEREALIEFLKTL